MHSNSFIECLLINQYFYTPQFLQYFISSLTYLCQNYQDYYNARASNVWETLVSILSGVDDLSLDIYSSILTSLSIIAEGPQILDQNEKSNSELNPVINWSLPGEIIASLFPQLTHLVYSLLIRVSPKCFISNVQNYQDEDNLIGLKAILNVFSQI